MKKLIILAIVVCTAFSVSAQEKGQWGVAPKIGLYTNAGGDGVIFGLGAAGRYSFSDALRIEPTIIALCKKGCSFDFSCDVQYLFEVASKWKVYPLAGISANDIGSWSCGINLGGGTDYQISSNWDLTAGIKWMIQTAAYHKNPIIISLGGVYKF